MRRRSRRSERWCSGWWPPRRLEVNDAAMLVSLAGDLRICQVVDPLMTCRLEIPKSILTTLGITLPAIGLDSPA